jgi:hypothetical protein
MKMMMDAEEIKKAKVLDILRHGFAVLKPHQQLKPFYYTARLWLQFMGKSEEEIQSVLKEKDFRAWLKEHDWSIYQNNHVAIGCSVDAIIPTWAYMLIASKLSGIATTVHYGDLDSLDRELWNAALGRIDFTQYQEAKIVVKGCSDKEVSPYAYVYVTEKLTPLVQSIMFGEPCSTVPVYKKKKSESLVD